ncbi:hypothetical protein V865_005272 [Kwoniella europaea PYCC6329]|uniref:Uncharacterized protein n=1 Tax=Kwoniella europaea PYCC6329 TaxID=1423913 RepID=A0AAX4KL57_9TREE
MNKRGPSGLPSKPYMQNNGPGPAPPLPTGPPPPVQAQQQYSQQGQPVDQAAHAAAWAAYYQAQGINPPATYSAGPQPAGPAAGPGTAGNPYANYGYGAGAQHGTYTAPVQPGMGVAGPSQPFRPTPGNQAYSPAPGGYGQQPGQYPQQAQAYSPNPTAGYSTPQPQAPPIQGQGRPPFNQQPGFAWGAQQPTPVTGTAPGYRPPQPQLTTTYPQQAGPGPYYPQPAQGQTPQQQQFAPTGNQPYRPQAQHSPYRPQGARPPRPPMPTPQPGGFPPAKRPRFDGPGAAGASVGMGNGVVRPPNGPMQNSINRPPSAPAAFNTGVNGGQPGFNNSSSASSSSRGGRGAAPIPTSRPPIHLGSGGPPPFGIGLGARGGAPLRGGYSGRGGRGGGMAGAPRGPSGMMRRDNNTPTGGGARSSLPPSKKDTPRKEKRREELRTTMTDFRIVGIEVKGLGWSWGKVGGQEVEEEEEVVKAEEKGDAVTAGDEVIEVPLIDNSDVKEETKEASGTNGESVDLSKMDETSEEAKLEVTETNEASAVAGDDVPEEKEKRGEKRKAKSPDSEEETAAKKRNSSYLLTHNKPNIPSTSEIPTSSIFGSNQNRFRIYFDSPPELDRIPKSARRKRGRESSSVAPSGAGENEVGDTEAVEEAEEVQRIKGEIEAEAEAETQPAHQNGVEAEAEPETQTEDPVEKTEVPTLPEATATENTETPPAQNTESEAQAIAAIVEAPEMTLPLEQVVEPVPNEEVGDVSMTTDPGQIPASETQAIEPEHVDPTSVTTELEAVPDAAPTDIEPPSTSTDTPNIVHAEPVNGENPQQDEIVETINPTEEKTRARRHSSVSSTDSKDYQSTIAGDQQNSQSHSQIAASSTQRSVPSTNRLSILYEKSLRRICIDSDVVEKVKIWRKEGRIEVELKDLEFESKEAQEIRLPKGILVESYDSNDQRYITLNSTSISTFFGQPDYTVPTEDGQSIPPFHKVLSTTVNSPSEGQGDSSEVAKINAAQNGQNDDNDIIAGSEQAQNVKHDESQTQPASSSSSKITLTVYLNRKNPLSEPKWCRNNSADNWLYEQFGSRRIEQDEENGVKGLGFGSAGWKGKLEVMDPDPAPTLKSILEQWSSTSSYGTSSTRESFISSLLLSPIETIEILLRLTRGDRNPVYSSNPTYFNKSFSSTIKKESPYTNHQTHISLAVLAMYRLTTDLVDKVSTDESEREKERKKLDENVNDIIRSLPLNMIQRSLDGLWKEWNAHNKDSGKNGSSSKDK